MGFESERIQKPSWHSHRAETYMDKYARIEHIRVRGVSDSMQSTNPTLLEPLAIDLGIFLLVLIYAINLLFAISIVFFERKKPTSALAWLAALVFLPGFGFLLYLVFGQTIYKEKIFRVKAEDDRKIQTAIQEQERELLEQDIPLESKIGDYYDLAYMFLTENKALISNDNEVEIFTDGNDKFNSLLAAINDARHHIHMEYYIIRNDDLGRRVLTALVQKAKEGVEVRLMGDAIGCNRLPKSFARELTDAGGQVAWFFPSKILHINLRVNYRNHRKIAIIDGKIGFVGGLNIGDEYLGKGPLGYWRDTHIRIAGSAVKSLQSRFFMDWNYAAKDNLVLEEKYFPDTRRREGVTMQIVHSGPDSIGEDIKFGYIKLINAARETVYIQTPYFIPDDSVLDALKIAARSGVDVRIMFPCKPDHPFVYWVTTSYIGELLEWGVRAYTYDNGFIHSKTIVVDGIAGSIGSANWDIRSFSLNFEGNAFIYDVMVAGRMKAIFEQDLKSCTEVTHQRYEQRPALIRIKESIFRLMAAVM